MTSARQADPSRASDRASQGDAVAGPISEQSTGNGDAQDTPDTRGPVSGDKAAADVSGVGEVAKTPRPRPAPESAASRVAQLDAEREARAAEKAARRKAEKKAQAGEVSATANAVVPSSKERKRLETQAQEMKIAQAELARLRPAKPQRRHYLIALSFVLFAMIPIGLTAWYLYVRAVDQYASYVGFLVRSEKSNSPLESLSGLAALAGNSSSDTDILYKYIQSSALVEAVAAKVDLNEIWSREPDDVVFNYDGDPRIEGLHRHWKRQVEIYYDEGMLDLRVLSFRAEDSRRIAEAILEVSQETLNRINAVARQDSLRYAQQDLDFAVVRLKEARQAVSNFRQTNQIIDPTADVTGQAAILTTLQTQLAEALVQLGTLRANAPDGDPRVQAAELRVNVIRDQIRDQRSNIASDGDGDIDLSGIVSQYEALQVDRLFAESSYTAALANYESARAEAGRQSLYLAAYVTPVEAQTAEYPRRARLLALAAGFILSVWLLAVLFYYGSRDRR